MGNSYTDLRYHDLLLSEDTIVAVSTPPGPGAIGIVRLSGPRSRGLANEIFRPAGTGRSLRPREMVYGRLRDGDETIDEAQVCVYARPHSYTGEDMAEIFVHGSPAVLRRVVSLLVKRGARPAEPGEYTLRAFRSGRLDLAQAEAVNDLVRAETDLARHLAVRTLRGDLRRAVEGIRTDLEDLVVRVETELEFEGEETGADAAGALRERLGALAGTLSGLAEAGRRQESHRRGALVAVCGKPNVGKSSLLNRILGRERAIVSTVPGTTRDTIEEAVEVDGIPVLFVDTAGYFTASAEPDVLGVERTLNAVADADIVAFMLDLDCGADGRDTAILERVRARAAETPLIPLANKSDLLAPADAETRARRMGEALSLPFPFAISAKTGSNVDAFLQQVKRLVLTKDILTGGIEFLINERHAAMLTEARSSLDKAAAAFHAGRTLDIIAHELHEALRSLNSILGLEGGTDVLDKIFSRFCIGK